MLVEGFIEGRYSTILLDLGDLEGMKMQALRVAAEGRFIKNGAAKRAAPLCKQFSLHTRVKANGKLVKPVGRANQTSSASTELAEI